MLTCVLQDVFSIESKDNRCECSSCRLRGQKSKLSCRHAELGEVKVKKLGTFRPAHDSLYLCPQKRENKNTFLFFPFHCNRINRDAQDSGLCNLKYSIATAEMAFYQEFILGHTNFEIPFKYPNANAKQSVQHMVLKLRRGSRAGDTM